MNCPDCSHENHPDARFCGRCGNDLAPRLDNAAVGSVNITKTVIFFITLVAFIVSLYFIDFASNYLDIILVDVLFAFIVIVFFLFNFKDTLRLFQFRDPKPALLTAVSVGAPIFALCIFLFVEYLNTSVFDYFVVSDYYLFIDSPAPFMLALLSTAIFPALFEEIAFRGVLFNLLEPFAGKNPTIFVTAIMFSMLHFSLISLLWLFPIGLLFGLLRAKHHTIWYGVIGHFLYNGSVLVFEILL